ncbi:M24 family metallopeptidase [Bacillus lacus]|uniref:M24 family metallopeptidase n=1 Tax=Metabacillus lacus TaxID=1983721 RepID=A0A7X2IYR7_9BACI|nr:Xaa-Pro peptidase family protein [Metabacillus lacus]MRX72271.1 M24 family metallopeptidase [Metabacillus lacus]
MAKRLKAVQKWLQQKDIPCAFISSTENVFYLTQFYTNPHERIMGVFVFQEEEPFFILPKMEQTQAKEAGWPYEIIGYEDHEDAWELAGSFLKKRSLKIDCVAVEKDHLSFSRAERLKEISGAGDFANVDSLLNELRMIKEEQEIEILRQAAKLADAGVEIGVSYLREGVTEMEVVAAIEYELKRKGIRSMSFSTMVLFGKKSGQPHGNPGLEVLAKGDLVLFDLGVVLDGYCSDITRTFAFGSVSEEQKEIYDTVLKAQKAALKASKPGTVLGDLDATARKVIDDAGYGEYFPHRLGHGLGINVHEYPSLAQNNKLMLKEGMVYTIEPGIYIPSIGGVRIEDDVLITKNAHETLTGYPKELQIIK